MPSLIDAQIFPPSNWEEFEDLCYEIWKANANYSEINKNGRKGQNQNGVDIFYYDNDKKGYVGIQCKGKDNYLKSELTKTEIDNEIEKAQLFNPKLKSFFFATTQPRDVNLQEYIREINEVHRKSNKFSVTIYFWEDIKSQLQNQKDVAIKFYRDYFIESYSASQPQISSPEIALSDLPETKNYQLQNTFTTKSIPNKNFRVDSVSSIFFDKYNSDIDYGKDLIINHKPEAALDYLNNLKKRIWNEANNILKFRILTNLASCNLAIGELKEATKLYLEALQYNPDDDKALTNAGLGYFLANDKEHAIILFQKAVEKNASNGRAFAFILQLMAESKKIEELENSIPIVLREEPEVLHSMGFVCQKNNELEKAKFYYEKSFSNKKENQIEIEISYASIQLELIANRNKHIFMFVPSNEEKAILKNCLNILDEVWNKYTETKIRKEKYYILVNISSIKIILHDYTGALKDIEDVIAIHGPDSSLIKNKAILLIKTKNEATAKTILEELCLKDPNQDIALILAELFESENNYEKAIYYLEYVLRKDTTNNYKANILLYLISLYIKIKNFEKSEEYFENLNNEFPDSFYNDIALSKINIAQNNIDQSKRNLIDAIPKCQTKEENFILAEELFNSELFKEASDLYRTFVDTSEMSYIFKRYVASLYYGGQLNEALIATKKIRENNKPYKFITEVEIDLYEKIGDLENALKVIKDYLDVFRDDKKMKLKKAFLHLRSSDFNNVDSFLDSIDIKDYLKLDLRELQKLSFLFSERNKFNESLQVIYELRRKHFDQPEAHMFYLNSFFMNENHIDLNLNKNVVEKDVGVKISSDDESSSEWFIIEKREAPDLTKQEINLEHPLAKALLGKKVGEKVRISGNENEITVLEIKHKYIHALHETMNKYHKLFPGQEDFKKISLKNSDNKKKGKYNFSSLFNYLDLLNKNNNNVEKYYLDGQLTLGAVSQFFGKSVIEVFGGFSNKEDIGIRCSLGSIPEMNSIIEQLENSNTLILDVLSLIIVYDFDIFLTLKKHFQEIIISQSTIDYLKDRITIKKGFQKRGYSTLHKDNEKYLRTIIQKETVSNQIDNLSQLVKWSSDNLLVAPCKELLNVEANKRESLSSMLLPPFYEAMLLAKEYNAFLYTDDLALRQLAMNDENVNGVWSQAILHFLLKKELITQDQYDTLIIKLIFSNFHYISITAITLVKQLKNSGYFPDQNFKKVFNVLGNRNTNLESAIIVSVEFLILLKDTKILDTIRKSIVEMILEVLTFNKNKTIICFIITTLLSKRLTFYPFYLKNLYEDIADWLTK